MVAPELAQLVAKTITFDGELVQCVNRHLRSESIPVAVGFKIGNPELGTVEIDVEAIEH